MSNQSIIVYRSQQEKLIDDFFMSGDFVPIAAGFGAGVATFVCLIGLSDYIKRKCQPYCRSNWYKRIDSIMSRVFYWIPEAVIYGAIACLIGFLVIKKMWI